MKHDDLVQWYGKRVRVTLEAAKDENENNRNQYAAAGTYEGILERSVGEEGKWAIVRGMDPKTGHDADQFDAEQVTKIEDLFLEEHTDIDPTELHKTPDAHPLGDDKNADGSPREDGPTRVDALQPPPYLGQQGQPGQPAADRPGVASDRDAGDRGAGSGESR